MSKTSKDMRKVEMLQNVRQTTNLRRVLLPIVVFLMIASCAPRDERATAVTNSEPLRAVATFFPVADIVRQVGGNHVSVETILPPGGELHSFAPTAKQMKLLQHADVVFALGLDAEPFLQTMLRGLGRRHPRVVELAEGCWTLPALAEHEHLHAHEEADHEEPVDPHVWLSLRNAIRMAQNARDALVALDPAHADDYQRNANRLITQLRDLRHILTERAKAWKQKKFIAAHGAYRYLAEEAGLEQVAVFEPLPGVEPSARWLRDLMNAARREQVQVIFAAPPASSRLVEAVAADLGVPVFLLDPMEQTWNRTEESYQQRMMRNIETLDRAMRR